MQVCADMVGGGFAIDEALQQGVAGHAVGAVQAGEAGFADGVEAGYVGLSVFVDHHAAASVVSGGDHRNRVAGDIQPQL